MKPNRLSVRRSEEEYFTLGLAILDLTEKDYKEHIAMDKEGNTFTKEVLISIGKNYDSFPV